MRWNLSLRVAAFSLASLAAFGTKGQSDDRILIDGSTGVMPLARALAKAFQANHPGLSIQFGEGLGTKARIEALAQGKIDIALASHGLDRTDISRQGLAAQEVGRAAVVFAVHGSVPVGNVTEQQICDIYAGNIVNWRVLGGPDAAIAARTRPDSEVDAEVVRGNLKCLKDLRMSEAVKVMQRSGDMAKELAATPGAIGMTSMTVVEQSEGKIRALSLNGVDPSAENVERKSYPLVREAYFVTKSAPRPAVAEFLDFVRGPRGGAVIRANGAIPVK